MLTLPLLLLLLVAEKLLLLLLQLPLMLLLLLLALLLVMLLQRGFDAGTERRVLQLLAGLPPGACLLPEHLLRLQRLELHPLRLRQRTHCLRQLTPDSETLHTSHQRAYMLLSWWTSRSAVTHARRIVRWQPRAEAAATRWRIVI